MHTGLFSTARLSSRPACAALLGLAVLALAPAAYAGAPLYTLTEISPLPGDSGSSGAGVNNSGEVACTSFAPQFTPNRNNHAFLYANGVLTDLTPGAADGFARGINNSGQVAGYSDLGGQLYGGQAFRLDTGINDNQQIATNITIDASTGQTHAALINPNGAGQIDLGTLPDGLNSYAYGINASGQVVGSSETTNFYRHAFLSGPNGGPLKDLGTLPGGNESEGLGVNASGQVTGYSETVGISNPHAFLSGPHGVGLIDLGTLPGATSSDGEAVNSSGTVVGFSDDEPFVFSSGVMTDLNSLIAPDKFFHMQQALSISDTGFITGVGYNSLLGRSEAFLLTPAAAVPEASPAVSFGLLLALGGLVAARRKHVRGTPLFRHSPLF